jgi:hypothetical protein
VPAEADGTAPPTRIGRPGGTAPAGGQTAHSQAPGLADSGARTVDTAGSHVPATPVSGVVAARPDGTPANGHTASRSGAPGSGAPGIRAPGSGAPGFGAPGSGAPGSGFPAAGMAGPSSPGVDVPAGGPAALGTPAIGTPALGLRPVGGEDSWGAPDQGAPTDGAGAFPNGEPVVPVVPALGQPRFSVPGLEHVVVEGTEPEPAGPIGYRTPARFARQQARVIPPTAAAPPSFEAAFAAPATPMPVVDHTTPNSPATAVLPAGLGAAPAGANPVGAESVGAESVDLLEAHRPTPARAHRNASSDGGSTTRRPFLPRRRSSEPQRARSTATAVAPDAPPMVTDATGTAAGLPARPAAASARPTSALGPTTGAFLGAVAGLTTIGLAAWWFTSPATVHAVGVLLGLLAILVSLVTLRNPATTWQRPVALLGVVLGTVGTLVLLWAVAVALGAPLPDLTGTGTSPTIAP